MDAPYLRCWMVHMMFDALVSDSFLLSVFEKGSFRLG
jgi:hypothetical protein